MKKLLAAFIAVIMLLSLIGCTEKNEIPKNEGNPTSDVSEGENVNTADPVGGAEGEENTDPGDSGGTDEPGETDEPDGTVEPDGTEEPDSASRFYFYLFEGGYITYVSAYRQENENGTLLGVLDCKTENAEIVTQNMRYAVVEDGERFLYDIETGEKTYPVWLSGGYDISFLDTDTDDEPVYIVMYDRDETTSSSALYDTRSESYLTDFDNRHYYLRKNSGYIVAEEENENGRISHVYRTDPLKRLLL